MDEQLAEQERVTYQTQKQLLALLRKESESMKRLTSAYKISDSCPMYESLHNLQLSKDDIKIMANLVMSYQLKYFVLLLAEFI